MDAIYEKYWDEFDDPASPFKWHSNTSRGRYYGSYLQFFVIDYLTLKLQSEIRFDQVFYYYKLFILNQAHFNSVEEELQELNKYSQIFKKLTKLESKTDFERLASRLIDMGISTANALLLFIEGDEEITTQDKNKIYRYLDSYITRRFLCGFTAKNYNNVFLEYLKFLTKNKSAEAFKDLLQTKTSETNLWPTDNILLDKMQDRPIYREEKNKSRIISNILLEIEHSIRSSKQEKVKFPNEGLTIEHILPQTWYEHWPLNDVYISDEDFYKADYAVMTEEDKAGKYHIIQNRNKILHTIGNLTILTSSLNPSVRNSSFDVKKSALANHSTVLLNTYFQSKSDWAEDEIVNRSKFLYEHAKTIWAY